MNRKNKINIILSIFIGFVIISIAYQIVINTQWYHWKKVNEFREQSSRDGGKPFLSHLNELINAGEIKYQEFIIDNSIPVENTRSQIKKKFPDLIWLQLLSYPDSDYGIKAADDNDELCRIKIWTKPSEMKEFKTYIKKRETNI